MKKIRASIDVGSNSVMLLIAEIDSNDEKQENFVVLDEDSKISALGKGLSETGVLSEVSQAETLSILLHYNDRIKKYRLSPSEIVVTGTEALRVATNAPAFIAEVRDKSGFEILVLKPEAEAYFSALGVSLGCKESKDGKDSDQNRRPSSIVLMDLGGASTELIRLNLHPFRIEEVLSLPLGASRCESWWISGEFEKRSREVLDYYKDQGLLSHFKTAKLMCNAGIMTSWANMLKGPSVRYDGELVHGSTFSWTQFITFWEKIISETPDTLIDRYPFLEKRAQVLIPGLAIARLIGENLGICEWEISTYGLRFGTLYHGAGAIPDGFIFRQGTRS